MNIGFVGTGSISSDVVTGICNSKIIFKKIILSPRNQRKSKNLKKKFKNIYIAKTNQEVIDKSDWVFGSQVFLKLKRKHDHMFQIVLTMSPKEALEIGEHLVIHAKTRIRHEGPVTN